MGRIINYYSCQPMSCKLNTVRNLKEHWLSSTHPMFHKEILYKLRCILRNNNYPYKIIDDVINNNRPNRINDSGKSCDRVRHFSMPYVGPSSMMIRKILQGLDPKINISFGRHNTGKEKFFSRIKDKTPTLQNSGVVYKIPCLGCPNVYVGETSQRLQARVSQHNSDVQNQKNHTALATHAVEMGHVFDFQAASIVGRENNMKKRKTLEAFNIIKYENNVNFKTDANHLRNVYETLIHNYQ